MHRKAQRTEFGETVARYAFDRGIPLTVVAQECNVPYESLRSVMYGRSPGHNLIPIVRDHMTKHPMVAPDPSSASPIPSFHPDYNTIHTQPQ